MNQNKHTHLYTYFETSNFRLISLMLSATSLRSFEASSNDSRPSSFLLSFCNKIQTKQKKTIKHKILNHFVKHPCDPLLSLAHLLPSCCLCLSVFFFTPFIHPSLWVCKRGWIQSSKSNNKSKKNNTERGREGGRGRGKNSTDALMSSCNNRGYLSKR